MCGMSDKDIESYEDFCDMVGNATDYAAGVAPSDFWAFESRSYAGVDVVYEYDPDNAESIRYAGLMGVAVGLADSLCGYASELTAEDYELPCVEKGAPSSYSAVCDAGDMAMEIIRGWALETARALLECYGKWLSEADTARFSDYVRTLA